MRGRKRGELAKKILEMIGESAVAFGDVADAILSSRYGESYFNMERRLYVAQKERGRQTVFREQKRKLYKLIHRLKQDGLVKKRESGKNGTLLITTKGKKLLASINKEYNLSPGKYVGIESEDLKIIAFDIPEEYRRKRGWLRGTLRNLGFTMLQKSLWIGNYTVPEEFLNDLQSKELIQYVHIFSVKKSGSLVSLSRN